MDKYLLEILKETNTIIIPGLGALTITNAATGEIMFMPYLKFDDSKLSQYIAEKEGISEIDAKNLIAKYVREVEAKLNIGESYDMYQFGTFKKNASGDLEFIQWNNEDKAKEPKTSPPSEIQNEENKIKDQPIETVHKHKLSEKAAVEEIIANEDSDTVESPEEEEITIDSSEPVVTEEISESEYVPEIMEEIIPPLSTYTVEDQWKDDLDIPPIGATIERPKKPILEKTQKDKKRKGSGFYILLTLGVLLIGGTLTFIMFYNSLEKFIPFLAKESSDKKEVIVEKEPVKIEETKTEDVQDVTEEPVAEPSEVTEPSEPVENEAETSSASGSDMLQTSTGIVDRTKPFHIVSGAFSDKANAERYRDRLANEGKHPIIIGEFDKLFIVSIASYESKESAETALQELKSISAKAWIFKFP